MDKPTPHESQIFFQGVIDATIEAGVRSFFKWNAGHSSRAPSIDCLNKVITPDNITQRDVANTTFVFLALMTKDRFPSLIDRGAAGLQVIRTFETFLERLNKEASNDEFHLSPGLKTDMAVKIWFNLIDILPPDQSRNAARALLQHINVNCNTLRDTVAFWMDQNDVAAVEGTAVEPQPRPSIHKRTVTPQAGRRG